MSEAVEQAASGENLFMELEQGATFCDDEQILHLTRFGKKLL